MWTENDKKHNQFDTKQASENIYEYIRVNFFNISHIRLKLDPEKIKQQSANSPNPQILQNGQGLPTLLSQIIQRRDGVIEKIENDLSKIIKGFERIYTEISSENTSLFKLKINGIEISSTHLSEGTLLLVTICTILHSNSCPKILLIDDIDRGLHPKAQIETINMLKKLIKNKNIQIITTAHSDNALSECAPEEVIYLDFDILNNTFIKKTTGDPRYMTPSEISHEWFGISRTGMDDLIQQYALLAGDVLRSEEEERQLQKLADELQAMGAKNLPPMEPRHL